MVLLWMFFDFEVEVLEGFEAWFLHSFCTSECFWIFFDATCTLEVLVYRNALGRLLFIGVWGVGERHVAKFDWWHMSQFNWRSFKNFFSKARGIFWLVEVFWFSRWHMSAPDWTAYVIAYMHRAAYVIAYTCQCVIGFCMHFMSLFQR